MSQKYAAYNAQGWIIAFYDSVVSPPPADLTNVIELTDAQYSQVGGIQGEWTVVNGVLTPPATPTAPELLAAAQANQVALLSAACAAQIVGGQQSAALGAPHTYPTKVTDQQNLASSVLSAVMAMIALAWTPDTVYAAGTVVLGAGVPMKAVAGGTSGAAAPAWPTKVDTIADDNGVQWEMWSTPFWCEDQSGNWAWVDHSAAQIQQAGNDVKTAILVCQAQNATLGAQVMAATTVDAVQAITWS